jgi:hypothetical protein
MPSLLVISVCSIQWFIIGYSLAYGDGSGVVGDFKYAFHRGVLSDPVGTIPAILFSEFQLVFEATVCAIAVGGACERGRALPLIPFIFVRLLETSSLQNSLLTIYIALVIVHILPSSPYGLVRNRLPRQPRRLGLCRWNTSAHLQRCHSFCPVDLSLLSPLPVSQV